MEGVHKDDQHLTDYPVTKKRARGAKSNMNYRIEIAEQNKPNVQLSGPGHPSISLLRPRGQHFSEHIPRTGKKIYSNQQWRS
ncbi:hypothetical protein TNCV_105541 [Trichonephila clavipes]|nr:hypothetical protein TNCV_105541 [Trichonephila clavipes]